MFWKYFPHQEPFNNSTNINKVNNSTNINKVNNSTNINKVNNSTNINKANRQLSPKESLNSDGQQFYQYQQSKQTTLSSSH
jgi:hypothetical protein